LNDDGSSSVTFNTSALNGFASDGFSWNLAAPANAIELNATVTFSPDGTVAVGGQSSSYPSLEVWMYQPGQEPFNMVSMPETDITNLGQLDQTIPDVSWGWGVGGGGGGGDLSKMWDTSMEPLDE
jgi:hypothetical protein